MRIKKSRLSTKKRARRGLRKRQHLTAVFLGAGASKAFGFPTTGELLPKILKELSSGILFRGFKNARAHRTELQFFLNALLPELEKRPDQAPLITDLLSLLDYSLLMSRIPLRIASEAELARFRILLEQAIYDVLWWPYDHHSVPGILTSFTSWLLALDNPPRLRLGIITTNYDMAVDAELFEQLPGNDRENRFDFGFAWRDPWTGAVHSRPAELSTCLYKLHGSVNWLRCPLCEHIYINLWGVIGGRGFERTVDENNSCHCNHWPLQPMMVAPSLIRDIRDPNLSEVWKHTLELLRTASDWVIIGYSFPPEDISVRSLFLRALQGRNKPPNVSVVQRADPEVRGRYEIFFPHCKYVSGGLDKFLNYSANQQN